MKIVVCIKRVPDTEARIKIAGDGTSIDTAGVKFVISPYDEFALETALRLKEAKGAGEIIAITLGDASSAEQLRSALAMGADRAILLKGQATIDGSATAKALAEEIKTHSPDLVLCGMNAVDGDQQPMDQPHIVHQGVLLQQGGVAALTQMVDEPAALPHRDHIGGELGGVAGDQGADPDEVLGGAQPFGVDVADQVPVGGVKPPQ